MKYIIFVLAVFISVTAIAQDDILVKTDGTKYYMQIYDGVTNEKVLRYQVSAGWQYRIFTADYFTGSDDQLWSFEATEMFPGYFSIVNHAPEVGPTFHLMSYNWFAYFTDAANRDPKTDKEMQFKFVEVANGYFKLETIEKPTDGSLYGINYTPGADALNVDENGRADFGDVKSTDITPDNMVKMFFKVIEFNPLALFEESIVRGDELYNNNSDAPKKVLYDLFYTLEKAREIRVFGTEGEMLAYQTNIDAALAEFNQVLNLTAIINDARAFIETSPLADEVKNSFNAIVDEAEVFLNSEDLDYAEIDAVKAKIEGAQNVVDAIIAAQTFGESLVGQDSMLTTGLAVSTDAAKAVLADINSDASAYTSAISHLAKTQTIIDEVIVAKDLIATTPEFEEAKETLGMATMQIKNVINTVGTSIADLDLALLDMQNAIKAFKRALEAGDTPIVLKNADFEDGLADWNVESPTPGAAYPENKGVDGSRSITFWKGANYQMKVYQYINNIPNGTYQISCFARVSADNSIALYAESGENSKVLPLVNEGGLAKRTIEVEVTNGMLQFGIKGNGTDNGIPAGNWIVFDAFEVKWKALVPIQNPGFQEEFEGWTSNASPGVPYLENKGVDGSRSVTYWKGSEYFVSLSQTINGIANGTYSISAMTNVAAAAEDLFTLFGESGGQAYNGLIKSQGGLGKSKVVVEVTDGTLTFGIKGSGENNSVPGGRWIVFDQFEVVRMPDVPLLNPGFEQEFTSWTNEATAGVPYLENKGVDGSRSVTYWKGSAYNAITYQMLNGLLNGAYEISAMTNVAAAAEDLFTLFGESGGQAHNLLIKSLGGLGKSKVLAEVIDGSLTFGIKGSGENNSIPAGRWIVFDNFEVKMKSIIPEYVTVEPTPTQMLVTDLETQNMDNKVTYWQTNQQLNIHSTNLIVKYAVYSITGAIIEQNETRNNTLSLAMSKGIYVVQVLTENGFVDTEKVVIR